MFLPENMSSDCISFPLAAPNRQATLHRLQLWGRTHRNSKHNGHACFPMFGQLSEMMSMVFWSVFDPLKTIPRKTSIKEIWVSQRHRRSRWPEFLTCFWMIVSINFILFRRPQHSHLHFYPHLCIGCCHYHASAESAGFDFPSLSKQICIKSKLRFRVCIK